MQRYIQDNEITFVCSVTSHPCVIPYQMSQSHQQLLEAALSLQAAARRFAPDSGATVHVTSACEIDKGCQKVLLGTFGDEQCIFPDITKIDMDKKLSYCIRHDRMCELQPEQDDTCT